MVAVETSLAEGVDVRKLRPSLVTEPILVGAALALASIGILMIYSTTGVVAVTTLGDSWYYVKRQLVALIIGVIALLGLSFLPLTVIKRAAVPLYLSCLVLLALTVVSPLGVGGGGARRWLVFRGLRVQPGEIAKLGVVLLLAHYFSRREALLHSVTDGIVKPMALILPAVVLLLMQPDFGTAVVICSIVLSVGLVLGVRIMPIFVAAVALSLSATLLVIMYPYRMRRITGFLNPLANPEGEGYHLIQSLIAVGRGGLYGVGVGNSQQKLSFLPAAHTDFIFAVIGEEFGLLGCLAVIIIYLIILYRGCRLAASVVSDTFACALAFGATLFLVVPAIINMGVVLGLLPTKGLVLPLISYGGSNCVVSLAAIGVLLSVARYRYRVLRL